MDYDLRFKLNNGQKSRITKLYHQYETLIRRPEDFSSVTLSKRRAKAVNGAAYELKAGKKIKLVFFGKVEKVGRDSITVKEGVFTNKIYDGSGADLLKRIENFDFNKLGKNQVATITLNGRQFNIRFAQKEMMLNYLKDWSPKEAKEKLLSKKKSQELKADLFSHMQITTVNVPKIGEYRGKKKATKNRSNRR